MEIAIDFDGTICKHVYPQIGEPVPNALEVMHRLQAKGHQLYLWTMRSNDSLILACDYLWNNGIILDGVNKNESQNSWTTSPKLLANIYIDDAALGCPLVFQDGERPYVDWFIVEKWLEAEGVI